MPMRLLVVEDDADILSSLVEVLREEGFEVVSAANGYQALGQLEQRQIDLVFLDLMMPLMDGWRFLEEAHTRFPHFHAPVVLLSAVRDLSEHARSLGVARSLAKPFDLGEVVRTAHELVPQRSHQRPAG